MSTLAPGAIVVGRSRAIQRLVRLGLVALLGLTACVSGGQQSLRDGILRTGIGQKAFLSEWGPPERTTAMATSEAETRAQIGPWRWQGASMSQGRRPLDVWHYDRYGVELVFDDGDLVAWRTEQTVEQLRTIPTTRARR